MTFFQYGRSIERKQLSSGTETTFLNTTVYKGERFEKDSVLDWRTHFKPTETFQYTHYTSCHPLGVKRGFVKGEALRLLRTNSSKELFCREDKKLQRETPRQRLSRKVNTENTFRSKFRGHETSPPAET